jgi:RNA polymerase sigma-70 factor, ECF subfamily
MSTSSQPEHDPAGPALDVVMRERPHLVNLTYRLLGSLAEAEDAVQETYARWYALSPRQKEAIESPGAWLSTVASRICLDVLGSARAKRQTYVGQWLPEPLPDPSEWGASLRKAGADPADRVTLDESVSMAFMVVLDSMTPAERVAFVLHDVFAYPFNEVAVITGRSPAACRKLASSARHRIHANRPPATSTGRQASVVRDFKQAWEARDIGALVGLLDPDVTLTGDGGGLVNAALRPYQGGEQVARFLDRIAGTAPANGVLLECTVNGQPGLVGHIEGEIVAVYAFEITGDMITRIWSVLSPDKLRLWRMASLEDPTPEQVRLLPGRRYMTATED